MSYDARMRSGRTVVRVRDSRTGAVPWSLVSDITSHRSLVARVRRAQVRRAVHGEAAGGVTAASSCAGGRRSAHAVASCFRGTHVVAERPTVGTE